MKDMRSTWRFRVLVVFALTGALALGSFWLLEVMRRAASDFIATPDRSEPDFYVEKFNYVKISKTGKAQYHFSGDRLTHNPVNDSYDVTHPVVRNIGTAKTPMKMWSERAHVNSDSSEIHMHDDVHIDRPATGDSEHMHVKSDYMLLLPDDEIMKTHKPAEITVGQSILTGTGMVANNATRELRLSSNVHGTYQAPAR